MLPTIKASTERATTQRQQIKWKGAILRDLIGEEYSALGVARDAGGVVVAEAPPESEGAHEGLRANDLIQAIEGKPVRNVDEFLNQLCEASPVRSAKFDVIRHQRRESLKMRRGALP